MRHMRLLPLLLLPTLFSCDTTDPPPQHQPSILLSAEDVSCTEAWLKVSLTDASEPRTIAIQQDGQRVTVSSLRSPDSVLVIGGLLPRRSYTFVAQRLQQDSMVIDASAPAQATTMDTTSHSFSFRLDTLGAGNSSVLYDVAIINDTLTYAVGEVYLRDSTGQIDPQAWNAAKWNGQRWELKRIPFIGPCSAVLYPPVKAIWAISATNMLVTNGGSIVSYDGTNAIMDCRMNSLLTGAINKLFAANSQDVYAVGNNGCIVHFNGSNWQRVESGTALHLYDIVGESGSGINREVYVVGGRYLQGPEHTILQLNGTNVIEMSSSGIPSTLYCMWFHPQRKYYVAGSGLFRKNVIVSSSPWTDLGQTNYFLSSIRGNGLDDVMACGAFGEVVHYNGVMWRSYRTTTGIVNGRYTSIAVKGDRVFAVGFDLPNAIVLRGQRSR